jgi:AmmeMemoRadiSam system protein B
MRSRLTITSIALAAVSLGTAAWFLVPRPVAAPVVATAERSEPTATVHYSIYPTSPFFDNAYAGATAPLLLPDEAARAVAFVTPHHLVVRESIAAMFKSFEGAAATTVVLVSPDHFARGRGSATVSEATWKTPYGDLELDSVMAAALVNSGARVDERPFQGEHGITGLVAFVRRSMPRAKIVPLLLRSDVKKERVDQLAQVLAEAASVTAMKGGRLLVIASVDFTHEADAATAETHDSATVAALQAFDYAGLAASNVDSPATLRLTTKYAELTGAKAFRQLSQTHSERLIGHPERLGTSHVIGAFLK